MKCPMPIGNRLEPFDSLVSAHVTNTMTWHQRGNYGKNEISSILVKSFWLHSNPLSTESQFLRSSNESQTRKPAGYAIRTILYKQFGFIHWIDGVNWTP